MINVFAKVFRNPAASILLIVLLLIPAVTVRALSTGCQYLVTNPPAYVTTDTFEAGDIITLNIYTMSLSLTSINLEVNGSAVDLITTAPDTLSYTVPSDGVYTIERTTTGSGGYTFIWGCSGSTLSPDFRETSVLNCYFGDGRINHSDCAAPVVVYPYQNEMSGIGFEIYTPEGLSVLLITGDMISQTGVNPASNELISSDTERDIFVYRLTDGSFQINARMSNGKTYIMQFDEPFAHIGYFSIEIE